jgi:hypothetical protein
MDDEKTQRAARPPRPPPAQRSSWSPAGVYPEALASKRRYLDRLRVHHLDLTRRFIEADDSNMFGQTSSS